MTEMAALSFFNTSEAKGRISSANYCLSRSIDIGPGL